MIVNVPNGSDNKNVLWHVDDEVKVKIEDLGVPVPSDIKIIYDIIYFKGKYHILGEDSNTTYVWIYDNNVWTKYETGMNSLCTYGQLIEYKNKLYCTLEADNSSVSFEVFDENYEVSSVYSRTGGSKLRIEVDKDEENDLLYIVTADNGTSAKMYYATFDGTTLSSNIDIISGKLTLLGAHIKDSYICIYYQDGTVYKFNRTHLGDTSNKKTEILTNARRYKYINNRVYSHVNDYNKVYKVSSTETEDVIAHDILGLGHAHENGILAVYSEKWSMTEASISIIKEYKEATATLEKSTKLTVDNAFPISDNLKVTEGGYVVSETGEVKIGIY